MLTENTVWNSDFELRFQSFDSADWYKNDERLSVTEHDTSCLRKQKPLLMNSGLKLETRTNMRSTSSVYF